MTGPGESRRSDQSESPHRSLRSVNAQSAAVLARERASDVARARRTSVALVAGLSVLFLVLRYVFVGRGARADARRREEHACFVQAIQMARTENEAYEVLKRHIDSR